MDSKNKIKTIFSVDAVSVISDTTDETKGEAQIGYEYNFDTSLPELAYAISGFLKAINDDEDLKSTLNTDKTVGESFLTLVKLYYDAEDV